jgi:hypothetical protein
LGKQFGSFGRAQSRATAQIGEAFRAARLARQLLRVTSKRCEQATERLITNRLVPGLPTLDCSRRDADGVRKFAHRHTLVSASPLQEYR